MAEPASILSLEQLKNQNIMGCFSFVIPEPFDSTYYLAIISLFMVIVLSCPLVIYST